MPGLKKDARLAIAALRARLIIEIRHDPPDLNYILNTHPLPLSSCSQTFL